MAQESIMDVLKRVSVSPSADTAYVATTLLNTFNAAVTRIGQREFWTPNDMLLFGKALALLDGVRPLEPEQQQYEPEPQRPQHPQRQNYAPNVERDMADTIDRGLRQREQPHPHGERLPNPLDRRPNAADPYEPNGGEYVPEEEQYPEQPRGPRRR